MIPRSSRQLDEAEQRRVDDLYRSARLAHVWGIGVAAVLIVLSAMGSGSLVELPFGGIVLPAVPAAVLGYGFVVVMAGVGDWYLCTAMAYSCFDPRRPPFAWLFLSGGYPAIGAWAVGLFLPVILASLACASLLSAAAVDPKVWNVSVLSLIFGGLMFSTLPTFVGTYCQMLEERKDWSGAPLSLSVWLHFGMRIVRQVAMGTALFLPVFSVIQPWREFVHGASKILWVFAIGIMSVCYCCIPFSKRIDRRGVKHGFASAYSPRGES